MAKSKRAKIVHLTKAAKKGKEGKTKLIDQIREAATTYSHIYLFKVQNMRNISFKEMRGAIDGRFFIGKNKVMAIALGLEESSECLPGVQQVADYLKGNVGLLFTNLNSEKVEDIFEAHTADDFARAGNRAVMGVVIEADPKGLRNFETQELISATSEHHLRQAGMPTKLHGGIILLNTPEYLVCQEGDILTVNQSSILKTFGIKMAQFKVHLVGHFFDGKLHTSYEVPDLDDGQSVLMETVKEDL